MDNYWTLFWSPIGSRLELRRHFDNLPACMCVPCLFNSKFSEIAKYTQHVNKYCLVILSNRLVA